MTGVKYEKNKAAQDTILRRVEGYMKRAEDLKNVIDQKASGAGRAASTCRSICVGASTGAAPL